VRASWARRQLPLQTSSRRIGRSNRNGVSGGSFDASLRLQGRRSTDVCDGRRHVLRGGVCGSHDSGATGFGSGTDQSAALRVRLDRARLRSVSRAGIFDRPDRGSKATTALRRRNWQPRLRTSDSCSRPQPSPDISGTTAHRWHGTRSHSDEASWGVRLRVVAERVRSLTVSGIRCGLGAPGRQSVRLMVHGRGQIV
jgi:hypothetical protein